MDEWFGCKDILAQGWGKTPLWWGGGVAGILCFKVGSKKFLCFKPYEHGLPGTRGDSTGIDIEFTTSPLLS